jgi:hypothetical protein
MERQRHARVQAPTTNGIIAAPLLWINHDEPKSMCTVRFVHRKELNVRSQIPLPSSEQPEAGA